MMAAEFHSLVAREPPAEADVCTVLIADDDDIVCAHLGELMAAAGYSVRLASTGVEALRVLDAEPVHIVISDWEMPDMDGLALCRHIRSRRTQLYTYVLMLTIRRSHDDVVAGLTAGADDYIVKGAEPAELLARVNVGKRITTLERSLREATRESQRLAMTDALTGALNRRYLMTYLPREIEHSRRHGHALTVLICDLDHFKRINDEFGHKAGDQVLEDFRARCARTIRASDWIARSGGEEFVIVLPETDLDGAAIVAENVRQAVCAQPVATVAGAVSVTVSIGYSSLCTPSDFSKWQCEDLLRVADKQLYVAKSAGRNRCAGSSMNDALGANPDSTCARAMPGEIEGSTDTADRRLRSIAYVDDEPDLREVVKLALSLTTQATVHCYESGSQALQQLPSLHPDLVLLDVMMPGMDGTEVIQRMQDNQSLKDIPVIFMTAKAMPEEVARFRSLGAIGVIAKPFDPTRLGTEVLAHWQAVTRHG